MSRKIKGTKDRPRLAVYRSLKHIYAQIIDDEAGITLISASDFNLSKKNQDKSKAAFEVGRFLAQKAVKKKIKKITFDRRKFAYHGIIKSLAEGAREGGLEF